MCVCGQKGKTSVVVHLDRQLDHVKECLGGS